MSFLRRAPRELLGLLVEHGFTAVAALSAVAIGWMLTRESLLGSTAAAGFIMFALLGTSLGMSVVRAARRHRSATQQGSMTRA
jgi:F0F1-type ATP synthase assembly protein I